MTVSSPPPPRPDLRLPGPVLDLDVDLHVGSTFSYGRSTLLELAARATVTGLRELGAADHVAPEPAWFEDYVAAVRATDAVCGVRIRCGLEVGLLDGAGRIDLPPAIRPRLSRLDYVVLVPTRARVWSRGGAAPSAEQVVEDVLLASMRAAATLPVPVVLTSPFAVLPGLGLDEREVPDDTVRELGWALARAGVAVEVTERWRSPSRRGAHLLAAAGVSLVAGSAAHAAADIGRWDHVAAVARTRTAPEPNPHPHRGDPRVELEHLRDQAGRTDPPPATTPGPGGIPGSSHIPSHLPSHAPSHGRS